MEMAPHGYLRTFWGDKDTASLSYARFPVEEYPKVEALLRAQGRHINDWIGKHELDGKMLVKQQKKREREQRYQEFMDAAASIVRLLQ